MGEISEPVWIGVDPGGRHTGVVATSGPVVVGHLVIDRDGDEPAWVYGRRVLAIVLTLALKWDLPPSGNYRYAVEDVVPIVPHVRKRPINPMPLIETGIVLGAVTSGLPAPTVVRPAGHGSHPLGCYPPELVTAGERRRKGWEMRVGKSSAMRHARSAWDVVQAARLQERTRPDRGMPHSRSQPHDDRGAA